MQVLRRRSALVLVAAWLLSAVAHAQAPTIPPFSADMTIKDSSRGTNMTGKMYWGGQKIRMDMDVPGHKVSIISDVDAQTTYMLMPEQKMYMEMSGKSIMHGPKMPDVKPFDPANPCGSMTDYTCEKQGSETVNGRSTDKWLFKSKTGDTQHTAWIDQKLHFPVRTVTSEGTQVDMTNIVEGSQDASLFQVPSGYQKLDMGRMMQGTGRDQ